jgi:hypothetical protein
MERGKMKTKRKVTLASIIRDMERAIATVDQLFADTAHWNRLHPEEEPIEADPDGEMAAIKRYAEAMIRECCRPRKIGEPIVVNAPLPKSVRQRLSGS